MISSPFSTGPIELGGGSRQSAWPQDHPRLEPLEPDACPRLAAAIVAMEPWSVMNYPAEALAALLASRDAGASRHVIRVGTREAGVVSVRFPWLKGPYLELLALLPAAQNQGIGSSILAWLERTAIDFDARNLWVCASAFNVRALQFYERKGFRRTAILPGLVAEGYEEILLRKHPLGPPR